jgi:hypothetical protein
VFYKDKDGDGYGDANDQTLACTQPSGYVSNSSDCNDNDPNINPGKTEICDSKDNDCDGQIDEGVLLVFYRDKDGDGYGDANDQTLACAQPTGYVSNSSDCNDNDPDMNPAKTEICDRKDNDCDGQIDEDIVCEVPLPIARVEISNYGELIGLEAPEGYEHLKTGTYKEGYLVACMTPDNMDHVVIATHDSRANVTTVSFSFVEPSTPITDPYVVLTTPNIISVKTKSSDNVIQLNQIYKFDGYEVRITMELENIYSGTITNCVLKRVSDIDTDTGGMFGWAGYQNTWDVTTNSVRAWSRNPPSEREAHMVIMRGSPTPTTVMVDDWNDSYGRESPIDFYSFPVTGDYNATLEWFFPVIEAGKSFSVTVTYYVTNVTGSVSGGSAPSIFFGEKEERISFGREQKQAYGCSSANIVFYVLYLIFPAFVLFVLLKRKLVKN